MISLFKYLLWELLDFSLVAFFYVITAIPALLLLVYDNITHRLFRHRHIPAPKPVHILITGASMGIGKHLALQYASIPSTKAITITGRNEERLKQTKNEILKINSSIIVSCLVVDVREREELKKAMIENEKSVQIPYNIVVANAGVTDWVVTSRENCTSFSEVCHTVVDTNVNGMLNTVLPALELFEQRMSEPETKQIIIIGSIAGTSGTGHNFYGATKSFANDFARGLRKRVVKLKTVVTLILPGFIETDMITDLKNKNITSVSYSVEKLCKLIVQEAARGTEAVAIPSHMAPFAKAVSMLPFEMSSSLMFLADRLFYNTYPLYFLGSKKKFQ